MVINIIKPDLKMPDGFFANLLGRSPPQKQPVESTALDRTKTEQKGAPLALPRSEDALRSLSGPVNTSRRLLDVAHTRRLESNAPVHRSRKACVAPNLEDRQPSLDRLASNDSSEQRLQSWPGGLARKDRIHGQAGGEEPMASPRHKRHVSFSVPEPPSRPDLRHRRTISGTGPEGRREERGRPLYLSGHRSSTSLQQTQVLEHQEGRSLAKILEVGGSEHPRSSRGQPQPPQLEENSQRSRRDDGGLAMKLKNAGVTTIQAQSPARTVVVSSESAQPARIPAEAQGRLHEQRGAKEPARFGQAAPPARPNDPRPYGMREGGGNSSDSSVDNRQRVAWRGRGERDKEWARLAGPGRDERDAAQAPRQRRRDSQRSEPSSAVGQRGQGQIMLSAGRGGLRSGPPLSAAFFALVSV